MLNLQRKEEFYWIITQKFFKKFICSTVAGQFLSVIEVNVTILPQKGV